jgi:hypothetical protein
MHSSFGWESLTILLEEGFNAIFFISKKREAMGDMNS